MFSFFHELNVECLFDVLHRAAIITSSLYSDWLRLLKHLSCLNVGSWHEPFRHGVQVRNIQSAYSGPTVSLICLYQPKFLPFLQRYAAFRGRFKWIEGSTFPKNWKRLRVEKFIVAVDILKIFSPRAPRDKCVLPRPDSG